jgi:hypothetical protein
LPYLYCRDVEVSLYIKPLQTRMQ